MKLDEFKRLVDSATPGPWNYEEERYSARCVIGIKPRDDRWVAHCQPEMNGEVNGAFIAAARTLVPKLLAVAEAARSVLSEDGVKEHLSAYVMGVELIDRLADLEGRMADYRFIAAARTMVPKLLKVAEAGRLIPNCWAGEIHGAMDDLVRALAELEADDA